MVKRPSEPKKVDSGSQDAEALVKPISHSPFPAKWSQWSPEDWKKLVQGKKEGKTYEEISKSIPNHTEQQCEYEWKKGTRKPQPACDTGNRWSRDEDDICVSCRMNGETWVEISGKLPGRTPEACRLHHYRSHPQMSKLERRGSCEAEAEDEDSVGDDGVDEEEEEDDPDAEGDSDYDEAWTNSAHYTQRGPCDAHVDLG